MGELTTKKQNLPSKETVGQYVHDMLDLEIRAHSLRQTATECRENATRGEQNETRFFEEAKLQKEKAFEWLERERAVPKLKFRKFYREKRRENGFFVTLGSVFCIAGIFILLADLIPGFERFFPESDGIGDTIFVALPLGIIGLVIFLLEFLYIKSNFNDERYFRNRGLKIAQNFYEEKTQAFEVAEKRMQKMQIYAQTLRTHAYRLDKDIAEIENALEKNYSLNIVPPDYRRLECMVWIDYAFRNDQVDTMREATLQCDKWTRHGEMMNVLNELARNFRSIENLLQKINANISMMNQELFRIAEIQEMRLSETQSARYAMESVQKSTEKLAMYEEMKRNGTF